MKRKDLQGILRLTKVQVAISADCAEHIKKCKQILISLPSCFNKYNAFLFLKQTNLYVSLVLETRL